MSKNFSGLATFARIFAKSFSASNSGYSARAISHRESRVARPLNAVSGSGDRCSPSSVHRAASRICMLVGLELISGTSEKVAVSRIDTD